jgi:hypothetical protein
MLNLKTYNMFNKMSSIIDYCKQKNIKLDELEKC